MKTVPLTLGLEGRQIGWAHVQITSDGRSLQIEAEIDEEEQAARMLLQRTDSFSLGGLHE